MAHKSHTSPLNELIVTVWEPGEQDVVSCWTDNLDNPDSWKYIKASPSYLSLRCWKPLVASDLSLGVPSETERLYD